MSEGRAADGRHAHSPTEDAARARVRSRVAFAVNHPAPDLASSTPYCSASSSTRASRAPASATWSRETSAACVL